MRDSQDMREIDLLVPRANALLLLRMLGETPLCPFTREQRIGKIHTLDEQQHQDFYEH